MSTTEKVLARIDADAADSLARWMDWLRIPSVSAQPAHAADCRRAAEFVAGQLAEIGFTAEVRDTAGHPCVLAHHPGPGGDAPHLLYYGHYDVQPAEPVELWTHPPFEPTVVEGPHGPRVVARGAVDDKGQVAMWLAAFRAWHAETGTLPCRVTALIEGEEEISSLNFKPFVVAHREELKADIAVISDTGMWDIDTPALSTSLRGIVYMQVDLKAANRDLHSGIYGGSALNPINALATALGRLKDGNGRVQLPGFYDGVRDLSPEQAASWTALGFDEKRVLAGLGLSEPYGETDRTALERVWSRPTCDINGIWGGYQGPGSKTVIASEAGAKVSFRLVPGQDPERVAESFKAFMRANVPADAQLSFQTFGCGAGIEIPTDNRFVTAAAAALQEEYGKPAVMIGCGGSIPVVETLQQELGLATVLMGFGLEDDQVHSPNEKFEVKCFHKGTRSHARLLGKLAGR
ncbi:Dipeptidase [Rhodovastum atsumiense]|uniref:Dipeptidase n=1 Tax=Rhodovastum atsumiense TaxID=504468 RepID=A0A5M6IXD4_9PROT|nr:dipeptidase [Rhodovastum atsumiense]KAA5612035.1 dipeptidase [Rhodovastum atsumiense]CAH2604101.1 Dipeptidase [Rhodovastum atsumiense]